MQVDDKVKITMVAKVCEIRRDTVCVDGYNKDGKYYYTASVPIECVEVIHE